VEITSTITRHITSTILGGTTTITLGPSLPVTELPEKTDALEYEDEEEEEEPVTGNVPEPTIT